jgi:ubiquinone/menaquinone biosynthesis C-methylase UbiE
MELRLGRSTANAFNVEYRVRRVAKYIEGGNWLDYGCAEGGYTRALLEAGAANASGIDVVPDRIDLARKTHPDLSFYLSTGDVLPFPDGSFHGIFVNEVLEHVADEEGTLEELYRILCPGGCLIVMSPNRGFPFEGHVVRIRNWSSKSPTPFIPWLPKALTDQWVTARNYWPGELKRMIMSCGFLVIDTGFIMPAFGDYPWVPAAVAKGFRRRIMRIDSLPGIRRLGVSNVVVARRPVAPLDDSSH